MPRPRTGNPVGRPFTYPTDEERPTTVSVRIPHDLHAQAKRYVRLRHPMTLTELLLDGLRLRLGTPTDPRDMILSDDNTVMQELQGMIRAAVQAEVAKLSDFMDTSRRILAVDTHAPGVSHDDNTVLQKHDASAPGLAAAPMPDISYDDNTVIQQVAVSAESVMPGDTGCPADTDKAAIIGRLQAMKAQGMSLKGMATQLNNEDVPTLSGKGTWAKGTILKLLRTAIA